MKLRGKKIAALFLACALCSGSVMPVSATSISETQKKGEQLEEQKKAAEAEKSSLDNELKRRMICLRRKSRLSLLRMSLWRRK